VDDRVLRAADRVEGAADQLLAAWVSTWMVTSSGIIFSSIS
jgi:hypothetical protein